jgi:DNA-binding transcriptional LysR family regulator
MWMFLSQPSAWPKAGGPAKRAAPMHFDLTDLRLFVQVIENSSITHGAGQANMALASASARIKGMEEALGVPLLERGPRGVKPTPAGRALNHHARMVLQQLERMRGELGKYAQGLKGHVHLLSNTIAATEFLPQALATFLAHHPTVDVDLEERPSPEIVQAVAEGSADAGVVVDTNDLAKLETFPFAMDRLVLITSRDHPLGGFEQLAFHEVLDQEFVGLSRGSALQDTLGRQAILAGLPLKLRVRLSSFDAICRMVEHGAGVAVIPETATRPRRRSEIKVVHLTDAWALRKLVICVRRFDELSEHAKQLVEHLKTQSASSRTKPSGRPIKAGRRASGRCPR